VKRGDGVTVNFWHDFENDDVTVATGYPESGELDVRVKREAGLSIRLPGHSDGKAEVTRNDERVPILWKDGCVFLERVAAGERVRVKVAVPRLSRTETVMGRTIKTEWVGNTVSRMSPEGTEYPLFIRTGEKRAPRHVALRATK
jgi:hypothetical protein